MVGFPYDDLTGWRSVYPPQVFISQMEKVATGFAGGVATFHAALPVRPTTNSDFALLGELRIASAVELHFRSVANQARFVFARNALAKTATAAEAFPLLAELERLLQNEMKLARELHSVQRVDARIGFEASNQYYYVPVDLMEKVLNCQDLLERWLPAQRAVHREA